SLQRRRRLKRQLHRRQSLVRRRTPNLHLLPALLRVLPQRQPPLLGIPQSYQNPWPFRCTSQLLTRTISATGSKRDLTQLWRRSAIAKAPQAFSQAGSWFEEMVAPEDLRLMRTGEWAISKTRKSSLLWKSAITDLRRG